jgi:hypothetical protein
MEKAGYDIIYRHSHDIPIAGSETLRRIVIQKIVGIVTYHHFLAELHPDEHHARIKGLERKLEENGDRVVVQV